MCGRLGDFFKWGELSRPGKGSRKSVSRIRAVF